MTRLKGVCGEERAASEPPAGCGAEFDLNAVNVTVVRWHGRHPSQGGWQVIGRCPQDECEHVVVMARCTFAEARLWRGLGSAYVELGWPGEMDDPKWQDRCPEASDERAGQEARCAFSFYTEKSLGTEAAELAEEDA